MQFRCNIKLILNTSIASKLDQNIIIILDQKLDKKTDQQIKLDAN